MPSAITTPTTAGATSVARTIDPAAIGGASYDSDDNYSYLSFLASSTLSYSIMTRGTEDKLTVKYDNASGVETGDAHVRALSGDGTVLDEHDLTFGSGGESLLEQEFDLSSADEGDEIVLDREHDHGNDDLSAEIRMRIGEAE